MTPSSAVPAYLFLGELAAGSSLLGEGAAVCGSPGLRRHGRITAFVAASASFGGLVHDLGRPSRVANALRMVAPTSPLSVGSWLLGVYGPAAGLSGAAELARLIGGSSWPVRFLGAIARPASVVSAAVAPLVATYTSVVLADTTAPGWPSAREDLPVIFVGSAASAAGGLALLTVPLDEAKAARRLALSGVATEMAAQRLMASSMGGGAETVFAGNARRWRHLAAGAQGVGAALALFGRKSRVASAAAGVALTAGSVATRMAIFQAAQRGGREPRVRTAVSPPSTAR